MRTPVAYSVAGKPGVTIFAILMKHQELYEELRGLAAEMGLPVRIEMGDFDGGICTKNHQRLILINRRHDIPRRVNVIACALHGSGLLESIYVKPVLRQAIDDEVALAGIAGK